MNTGEEICKEHKIACQSPRLLQNTAGKGLRRSRINARKGNLRWCPLCVSRVLCVVFCVVAFRVWELEPNQTCDAAKYSCKTEPKLSTRMVIYRLRGQTLWGRN
jgi:hypothetical protein